MDLVLGASLEQRRVEDLVGNARGRERDRVHAPDVQGRIAAAERALDRDRIIGRRRNNSVVIGEGRSRGRSGSARTEDESQAKCRCRENKALHDLSLEPA